MKKIILKGLYASFLKLTNWFNIRQLSKVKILIGTALLVLMSGCCKEKEDEPEITCYDPVQPTDVTCYFTGEP